MFCGAYEGCDLDRCENGGVEEERKEAILNKEAGKVASQFDFLSHK